ncbi:MAG: molybdopterin-dependent oxidoreductase, partial [Anaerolineae bacterium]|nr:molybdopterin-dependent oxidoreductase [Anaerolineae bacterium]
MKRPYVGETLPRLDGAAKVAGHAPYSGDFNMEGQLYMKLRFAGRPHARIINVDTSKALAVPGVVAVFTSRDVPVNEYGLQYPDQPVLCGPGDPKEGTDIARFVGDQIAAVVAETEEAAAKGRDLIEIEFENLPVLTDPRDALEPGAAVLHPAYPGTPIHPELVFEGNVASHHRIRRGDVDAVWDQAAVVIEADYEIPGQEHAFLQPEAAVAYIDEEGRVTVIASTQWIHEDCRQIAHALKLPEDRVRMILPAIGGAFGGKEDLSVQIVAALAALQLQRPIKIVWTRRESIIGHHKRHRVFAHARWAADAEGHLLAAETRVIADAGAYV